MPHCIAASTPALVCLAVLVVVAVADAAGPENARPPRSIYEIPQDLIAPEMTGDEPAAGRRVRRVAAEYAGTEVYHSLYLPTDWKKGRTYPVIVEYAGNGPYRNRLGDRCTGRVEHCSLGYGASGGKGLLWICLPYISQDRKRNQLQWWGDANATADYCKAVVPRICRDYGGDAEAVFLAGFSRGAIACNYIGLRDDEIAGLWRGFICHSHYDGVRQWKHEGSDANAAAERLRRLKGRPQFISHESSVAQTRRYLAAACPDGNFTFLPLPWPNHTDTWVLRDVPERRRLRQWLADVLKK